MALLRKVIVVLIVVLPVVTDLGCKKQAKCGCDGDMLYEINREMVTIVQLTESSASCTPVGNPYSTYSFCNPREMYPDLQDFKVGDKILISAKVFWNCNYLYSASSYGYSYQYLYKYYDVMVSEVTTDLYGKK